MEVRWSLSNRKERRGHSSQMEGAWNFGYSRWELGSCHHMGSKALSRVSLLKPGG